MTYNKFKSDCKEAWRTEGMEDRVKYAHNILRRVIASLPIDATKQQILSAAWAEYKKTN